MIKIRRLKEVKIIEASVTENLRCHLVVVLKILITKEVGQ